MLGAWLIWARMAGRAAAALVSVARVQRRSPDATAVSRSKAASVVRAAARAGAGAVWVTVSGAVRA